MGSLNGPGFSFGQGGGGGSSEGETGAGGVYVHNASWCGFRPAPLQVEDLEADACAPTEASSVRLTDDAGAGIGFTRSGAVGSTRLWAMGTSTHALMTFGKEGEAPSVPLEGALAVQAQGKFLSVVKADRGRMVFSRHDAKGRAVGESFDLGEVRWGGLWVVAGPTSSLVLWAGNSALEGVVVDHARGPLPLELDLPMPLEGDSALGVWSAGTEAFEVFWNQIAASGLTTTRLVQIDAKGQVEEPTRVTEWTGTYLLRDAVPTDAGYALLFSGEELVAPEGVRSVLLSVNDVGAVIGKAKRLQGVDPVWGLASSGPQVAVTARQVGGGAVLRVFDATDLEPVAGWVCVDDADGGAFIPQAAVAPVDGGWGVSSRLVDGSLVWTRTDATGTAEP